MKKLPLVLAMCATLVMLFASGALAQQEGSRAVQGSEGGNAEGGGLGQPQVVTSDEIDDDGAGGGGASGGSGMSASASASSSASASTSASASASASSTATASASASALAQTGGPGSVMVLAPLALLVGSGLLAFRVVRRS